MAITSFLQSQKSLEKMQKAVDIFASQCYNTTCVAGAIAK